METVYESHGYALNIRHHYNGTFDVLTVAQNGAETAIGSGHKTYSTRRKPAGIDFHYDGQTFGNAKSAALYAMDKANQEA